MKDLKRKAAETRQPLPIPAQANGITVDCYNGAAVVTYGRPATYISPRPGLGSSCAQPAASAIHGKVWPTQQITNTASIADLNRIYDHGGEAVVRPSKPISKE